METDRTSGADGFGTPGEVRGGPASLVQLQQGGAEQELFLLWRQIDVQARGTLPFESILELLEQLGCPLPPNIDQRGVRASSCRRLYVNLSRAWFVAGDAGDGPRIWGRVRRVLF